MNKVRKFETETYECQHDRDDNFFFEFNLYEDNDVEVDIHIDPTGSGHNYVSLNESAFEEFYDDITKIKVEIERLKLERLISK